MIQNNPNSNTAKAAISIQIISGYFAIPQQNFGKFSLKYMFSVLTEPRLDASNDSISYMYDGKYNDITQWLE